MLEQHKRVLVLSKAREEKLHNKKFHDEEDIVESVVDEILIQLDLVWDFSEFRRCMIIF